MTKAPKLAVFGGGGHGEVIADAARISGQFSQVEIFDDRFAAGRTGNDLRALDLNDWLMVVAIGDNATRKKVAAEFGRVGFRFATVVHPRAIVAESAALGAGTVVMAGAVVNPFAQTGEHVIINTAASVDHHGILGNYSHIAPGTHLAGNVTIGEGAFLGVGTSVIPGMEIGAWSIVGAGSVVVRDIPSNKTVKGSPAK